VLITLVYVKEIEFEEGQLKFEIPSTMPPPNYKFPTPTLNISLNTTSMIKSIASPTHPISFEFGDEPTQATVKFAEGADQKLDKDFSLLIKLFKPNEPVYRIQEHKSDKVAMVALYPKLELAEDETLFSEIVFVIDRSGSMAGSRINQVKNCMQILLKSLAEGTMFNIVGFGTKFSKLFPEGSVEYSEKNLDTAMKHVTSLTANMGGTNIKEPLMAIFNEKPKEGIPRQIFLLTDGEVNNTQ